jgi:ribonucrease Y
LETLIVIIGVVALFIGFGGGFLINRRQFRQTIEQAQQSSKQILEDARKEADRMVKEAVREAKEDGRSRRSNFETEAKQKRSELAKIENKINQREQSIEKKMEILEKKEKDIDTMRESLNEEQDRNRRLTLEAEKALEQSRRQLQNIAGMTPEEAKRELIQSLEQTAKQEAQERVRRIVDDAKRDAEEKARSMVSLSVQRIASEYVNESTVSVVSIPSDEMKGRIIGREGRNIRAIETLTGVDLIIDDTPEAIIISSFNPIRREIAKIAIGRLMADGRIHPARIEETVKRVEADFEQILMESGEQACFEAGVTDLHPELIKALGRLKFRTAGQQSVLQHSLEVAHISGIMAAEMGLSVKKAKRVGLLHDVGKSVDHEQEGHHAKVGYDLLKKYEESEDVIDAVRDHHVEDVTNLSAYGMVVHAANNISANRPGARKELLESYVKRLADMEDFIRKNSKIENAYVIQAGREVRAMVAPQSLSDSEIVDLSQEIASSLRKELTFPGQIKVTVVRESRAQDFAK